MTEWDKSGHFLFKHINNSSKSKILWFKWKKKKKKCLICVSVGVADMKSLRTVVWGDPRTNVSSWYIFQIFIHLFLFSQTWVACSPHNFFCYLFLLTISCFRTISKKYLNSVTFSRSFVVVLLDLVLFWTVIVQHFLKAFTTCEYKVLWILNWI